MLSRCANGGVFSIEVGEHLSKQFEAILKAEIKRRNAEVDRTGHRVWCIQMRRQYESQGIDIEAPTSPYEEEVVERMKAEAAKATHPGLSATGRGTCAACRLFESRTERPSLRLNGAQNWKGLGLSSW